MSGGSGTPAMLDVAEARAILLAAAAPLGVEEVALDDALGRILAARVVADLDSPQADRSAMDGYAVRAEDTAEPGATLSITGEIPAGKPADGVEVARGQAVRIFTGGVVPRGADAIVMVERTEEDRAARTVTIRERALRGQNVRRRGEDLMAGATVLERGARLGPGRIAALAAVGRAYVSVFGIPRVAVLSTGNEVVPVASVPAPHQVRNSNAHALLAQLAELRVPSRHLGTAPDDAGALDAMLAEALLADVLLLTGGVSVGEFDLVGAALARAGCEILFHRVAMRPGKPILAARRAATLVLGLPGNPLSAFTGFHVFVAAALRKMSGDPAPVKASLRASLGEPLRRKPGPRTYHLGRLSWPAGAPVVTPVRSASSGDVLSLASADAFIVADGDARPIEAGASVEVEVFGA